MKTVYLLSPPPVQEVFDVAFVNLVATLLPNDFCAFASAALAENDQ